MRTFLLKLSQAVFGVKSHFVFWGNEQLQTCIHIQSLQLY